jgi:hypothetical protein
MATRATSAPSCGFGNPACKKQSSRYTYYLLRPVTRGLCRDDVLPTLLLDRETLRAQLELEPLLCPRFLKLLTECPV